MKQGGWNGSQILTALESDENENSKNPPLKGYSNLKGAGSRDVNKLPSKRMFCSIIDRPYHMMTEIFHYFSQNEGAFLMMDSWIS